MKNCLTLILFVLALQLHAETGGIVTSNTPSITSVRWVAAIINASSNNVGFVVTGSRSDIHGIANDVCNTNSLQIAGGRFALDQTSYAANLNEPSHVVITLWCGSSQIELLNVTRIFIEGETINLGNWHWDGSQLLPSSQYYGQPKLKPVWARVRQPDGSYVRKIVTFKKIR